jgi:hypothetical protein
MKHKVRESKDQKALRSPDTNLQKRLIELQKLREQVRLAEAVTRPRH